MNILPWHKQAFASLEKMIKQNHLPHALMITGVPYIGKFDLMQNLVGVLINDEEKIKKDNAREKLNYPVLIRRSNYHNMIYCKKELNKNIESKSIRVDQIRAFCEALNKTADGLQIGVLFYADEMNINAANSLLKTLEEPRKNTLIILLVHNINNLPSTVISRCQRVHIASCYDEDTCIWLQQNSDISFDAKKMLEDCYGVPYRVLKKINSDDFIDNKNWKNKLLDIAINPLMITNTKDFDGNELEALNCLQNLVIDSIRIKLLKLDYNLAGLNQIVKNIKASFLFMLLEDIYNAINLLKTNVNIKLLLNNILIVWSHITNLKYYPQIVSKI